MSSIPAFLLSQPLLAASRNASPPLITAAKETRLPLRIEKFFSEYLDLSVI